MSTTEEGPTGQMDRPKPARRVSKAARAYWGVYQQIAAVFAAFGLAALLGHYWDIGWRGFLETIVGVWDITIRPAIAFVFHILVTLPLSWLGLHIEVPLWLRDYVSVGVIYFFSLWRVFREKSVRRSPASVFNFLLRAIFEIAAWPYQVVSTIVVVIRTGIQVRASRRTMTLAKARVRSSLVSIAESRESIELKLHKLRTTRQAIVEGAITAHDVPLTELDALLGQVDSAIVSLLLSGEDYVDSLRNQSTNNKRLFTQGVVTRGTEVLRVFIVFSPLAYLALLLALNFWVLPHV